MNLFQHIMCVCVCVCVAERNVCVYLHICKFSCSIRIRNCNQNRTSIKKVVSHFRTNLFSPRVVLSVNITHIHTHSFKTFDITFHTASHTIGQKMQSSIRLSNRFPRRATIQKVTHLQRPSTTSSKKNSSYKVFIFFGSLI